MRHGLSAFLDLASFVRQLNCRMGRPKYGVLRVRKKEKRNPAAPGAVQAIFRACRDSSPSPVPMVFQERSYVREALVPLYREG